MGRSAALAAVEELCRKGAADVPVYDIPSSRRTGTARLDLGGRHVFVAEGIFAAERRLHPDAACSPTRTA